MHILTNFNETYRLSCLIKRHLQLFDSFNKIYLYGSILNSEKKPNDIDILLVYTEYSNYIMTDLNIISCFLANHNDLPIHFTVLSILEEKDTKFLERLKGKYLNLK